MHINYVTFTFLFVNVIMFCFDCMAFWSVRKLFDLNASSKAEFRVITCILVLLITVVMCKQFDRNY